MNTTIRHYTLNTGHMEISNPEEIDKDIYFTLQAIINHAKVETTDLIDNTCIRIIEEDSGYVCTLYGKHGGDLIQILSTAGTKKPEGRKYIWEAMEDAARFEFGNAYITRIPGEVPYIVDLIHISAPHFIEVLNWTGDFARCLGWMMLFPGELRKKLEVK